MRMPPIADVRGWLVSGNQAASRVEAMPTWAGAGEDAERVALPRNARRHSHGFRLDLSAAGQRVHASSAGGAIPPAGGGSP